MEINKFYAAAKNGSDDVRMLLADDVMVGRKPGENMNTLLVGPPGCGKTFSFMIPNILINDGVSMVIDDKKGNIWRKVGPYLKSRGYSLLVFDVADFGGNMKYNPFGLIRSREDRMRFAGYFVKDTKGTRADPFWTQTARQLCACLVEIGQQEKGRKFCMKDFFEILDMCGGCSDSYGSENGSDKVDRLINLQRERGMDYPGMQEYSQMKQSACNTWKSIVISLRTMADAYRSPKLLEALEYNSLDFASLGREKTALFIISPDSDTTFYPIVELLYRDIANALMRFADRCCDGRDNLLPYHVRFFVDDFASGCRQPDFENVVANCRSRNISYALAVQSMGQLEALYGDASQTIMDCMDYKAFYGSSNLSSNRYISQVMDRPLREVQRMGEDTECVIMRGQVPAFRRRVQTYQMPEYLKAEGLRRPHLEEE